MSSHQPSISHFLLLLICCTAAKAEPSMTTTTTTTTARPLFTPINPFSLLMNLAPVNRPNSAPVSIMNMQMKFAFRSGGNDLQVVLLNPGGSSSTAYNTSSLLLHYFEASNTSPTIANKVITQQCRSVGTSFLYCPFPDISELYPDFTADLYNTTLSVEPVGDFNGCKHSPGKSRLCYTVQGDNKQIGFVNAGNSQFFPEEALGFLRLSQTIMYYPDPVIFNVTLSGKRLKISGKGLNGDNAVFAKAYNFSLLGSRIKCAFTVVSPPEDTVAEQDSNFTATNVTTRAPKTTTELPKSTGSNLFCDFDDGRLAEMIEETYIKEPSEKKCEVNLDVAIHSGNWKYNTTLPYPLCNTQGTPLPPATHSRDGPSTELIVAIVVPICFISIVIAGACVVLCSMRYGASPGMIKAARRMETACPGPWNKWMNKWPPEKESSKAEPDDFTQLLRLLPSDMAETVQQHQIDSTRVVQGSELGTGYFGIVRSGKLMSPKDVGSGSSNSGDSLKGRSEQVALKFIQRYTDIDQLREFFQEAVYMFSFDHPNVLSAHGVTSISSFPAVVLPLMDAGDLQKFVRSASNQITDPLLVDFAIQIAKGMKYLAEKNIVHRDLAARNCLLSKQRIVKVADFGLSRKCDDINQYYEVPNYTIKTHGRPLPVRWMAPESLECGTFSEKTDVWAFGVVLWELTTRGARPYPAIEPSYLKRHICEEKQRLPKLPIISDCLYELMATCWDMHSSARPTFAELTVLTENLLNDPQSALWMSAANRLQYHDPEQLDQQLNQNFEDSLLAASAESTVTVDATTTANNTASSGATSHDGAPRNHSEMSDNPELVSTPSDASQFSAADSYNPTDSGLTSTTSPNLRHHSAIEMTMSDYSALAKTPVIAQYDRVNYSREDSGAHDEKRERGSGDVDSVFTGGNTSRPETPTPPDSAISGMSFAVTPNLNSRNSWCSRSFNGGGTSANFVRSTPSTDSAASTSSYGATSTALTNSIRRPRPNKLQMMMSNLHHPLTPIGTLGDDDTSLSSPKPCNNNNINGYDVINIDNAQRNNNNNNFNIVIDR